MTEDALARGMRAETAFYRLCDEYALERKFPAWVSGIERPTAEEEKRGADAFLRTTEGDRFPINVKASHASKAKYKKNRSRSHVTNVIISPDEGRARRRHDRDNFARMLEAINTKRLRLQEARRTGTFSLMLKKLDSVSRAQ
jgi:hypothetical protein